MKIVEPVPRPGRPYYSGPHSPPAHTRDVGEFMAARGKIAEASDEYKAANQAEREEQEARWRREEFLRELDVAVAIERMRFFSPDGFEDLVTRHGFSPQLRWLWVFVKHSEPVKRLRDAYKALKGKR